MLKQFYMNGDLWRVRFVSPNDNVLIDRTGQRTLAVSDYSTMTISIASNLHGELLNRVFIHELGHCVIGTARDILGNKFTYVAPVGAERMIA